MCFVITFISFLVHFYSLGYLSADHSLIRFLAYLSLFTFFMLLFVLSSNLIQMFIGWEGVGLVSYLLINFWYDRIPANRAAFKAIIMNRIGDFFFILAILFIWALFNTTDINQLSGLNFLEYSLTSTWFGISINKLTIIGFCLLIAAFVKSAQFGFHTWLADAMEGPTPVSALLHAATMVTAGVYLVIRLSFIFIVLPEINSLMLIISAITTFFASFVAFFQYDLKKIIAYSTCAQLGLMFVACALNQYILALFHLFNHAFFKALLFLCAGIIIHGANDEQDIRKYGNFKAFFPLTYKGFFIASLSLMGFPGLTGYYSKDPIFEILLIENAINTSPALFFICLGTFFTAAYSIRVLILVFFNKYSGNIIVKTNIHETNEKYLIIPIGVLSILSIAAGYVFAPFFLNPNLSMFKIATIVNYTNLNILNIEELPWKLKLLPLLLTITGTIFAYYSVYLPLFKNILKEQLASSLPINSKKTLTRPYYYNFITSILKTFNFDNFYYTFIIYPITWLSYDILYKHVEKGLFEYFGPTGIKYTLQHISNYIRRYNIITLSNMLILLLFSLIFLLLLFVATG